MSFRHLLPALALVCVLHEVLEAGSANPIARKRFEPGAIAALAFSSDGNMLVSGSFDGSLSLWTDGGKKEKFRVRHKGGVFAITFSPDGKWILSGGTDRLIRVWDAASGKEVAQLEGHGDAVTCLLFCPDGKALISGSVDKTVRLWDLAARKELRKFSAHASGVFTLGLTGDNLLVTTGEKTEILLGGHVNYTGPDKPRLWDIGSGKEVRAYDVSADRAVLSYDRRYLAMTGVETVEKPGVLTQTRIFVLRDAATGRALTDLKGPADSLAFSPDGRILAGVGKYGGLCLWEVATGRIIFHEPKVAGGLVAFSPDGKQVAWAESGKEDGPKEMPGDAPRFKSPPVHVLKLPPLADKWTAKARTATPAMLWQELADEDGAKAFPSLWTLAAMPEQAIATLKASLKAPAPRTDPAQIARLVTDLDDDQFAVRKKAEDALRKLSFEAEIPLRQALDSGKLTLEARRRAQALVAVLKMPFPQRGESLREGRALHILEMLGTPEALAVVRHLAAGPATSPIVLDAKRVLERRERLQRKSH